jgi:hypothetical protein
MKRYGMVLMTALFCLSSLFGAIYQGEKIDNKHFPAEITREESSSTYKVDVVFVGKAANIRFAANQILPFEANDSIFMTLYLQEEDIQDPENVVLKQVKPPDNMDDSKPEDWEAAALWHMKLDMNPPQ